MSVEFSVEKSRNETNNPRSVKSKRNSKFKDIALDYLKTIRGVNQLIVRPLDLSAKWHNFLRPQETHYWSEIKGLTKSANTLFAFASVPQKIHQIYQTSVDFQRNHKGLKALAKLKIAQKIVLEGISLVGPTCEVIKFSEKSGWISLSAPQWKAIRIFGFIGSLGFLITSIQEIFKKAIMLYKIHFNTPELSLRKKEVAMKQFTLTLLHFFQNMSFTILAVCGVVSFLFSVYLFPLWFMLSVSTFALVLTISSYFYQRIEEPFKKERLN